MTLQHKKGMLEIKKQIIESIDLKKSVLDDDAIIESLQQAVENIVAAYQRGNKVLFCGNGGSAADAQHLASELSGRFYFDRPALNAEALHVNTSFLTAAANDYSFEKVYERMISAVGNAGDVLVALSTSGSSPNVILALKKAKSLHINTIGLCGTHVSDMQDWCDILLSVPSRNTPRIQEVHILLGHIICENVERKLFGNDDQ